MFCLLLFFFHDTATPEIYTLSLHDALPICPLSRRPLRGWSILAGGSSRARQDRPVGGMDQDHFWSEDRKSTRLNSSHVEISYAVFCLKKKKTKKTRGTSCSLNRTATRTKTT